MYIYLAIICKYDIGFLFHRGMNPLQISEYVSDLKIISDFAHKDWPPA